MSGDGIAELKRSGLAMTSTNTLGNGSGDNVILTRKAGCTIQAVWTGSPTGTFYVEVSNDFDRDRNTGNWESINALIVPALPAVAGAAGSFAVNLDGLWYRFVRLRYVNASGSGTLAYTIMAW